MPGADEPVDADGGMRAAQRSGDGNRVHDVAKRAQLDDEELASTGAESATREPRHQVARRVVFRVADDGRAAAIRSHDGALRHGVDRVVGALAVHVRPNSVSRDSTVGSPNTTT